MGTPLAIETEFPIYDLAVDSQGRVWATTGGGPLVQLDPANGHILARYGPDGARGLAIDPLTDDVFYSSNEGIMRLNTFTGKITRFSTLRVDGMDFTPDGTLWTLSWPDRGELSQVGPARDRRGRAHPARRRRRPGRGPARLAVRRQADRQPQRRHGRAWSIPIALEVTTLASGGSRGDFAKSGPGGDVYVTQSDQIVVFEGLTVAPRVVASDPADGAALTDTRTTATVRFNLGMLADEPDRAPTRSTNPANYLLVGSRSGPVPISSVDYDRPDPDGHPPLRRPAVGPLRAPGPPGGPQRRRPGDGGPVHGHLHRGRGPAGHRRPARPTARSSPPA